MEKDKLKEFVDSNRTDFEVYDFDQNEIWEGVSKALDTQRKTVQVPIKYIWRAAASIVIMIGITGYLLMTKFYYGNEEMALTRVSPELAEAHQYYGNMIETKIHKINSSNVNLDPFIFEDIEALDKAFMELKNDLKDNADNEEVVNAMIYNYQLKLEILQKILDEINMEKGGVQNEGILN